MERQQSHPDEKNMKGEGESLGRDMDLGQVLAVQSTPEQERRVLWKLDLILIPLMGTAYFLQFLDKLALSQATLFNLRQDLASCSSG
ncbi:unnamed protein product [Penicillium salamii]|uniref:Uncharacterized protein n=1 Tax=Penicillium salamii TaxID=1612424 RepID=A0A9W4N1M3_9EURO|nr:unnamed protein product [Penicillium salamii]CAG8256416.1 unnamed protein product [Penicillium salamii]CAG8399811.1 unnamed protein product [Penicillium salamii]